MATSVSPGNTNLSQALSFERRDSFRDPSFSSYLSSFEDSYIAKLAESTQEASLPQGQVQFYTGRVKDTEEDGEIGVFGAEKYFKGELEEESARKVLSKRFSTMHPNQNESRQVKSTPSSSPNYLVSANMYPKGQKTQLGTRSVRSELSMNSQSALLHKVPRNRERSKSQRRSYVKNFLACLGCKCSDKAAVEVDEQSVENKKGAASSKEITKLPLTSVELVQEAKSKPWTEEEIHMIKLKREDCFSFPVLSSWDSAIPREEEIENPSYGTYNDAESDASSELFELESFSTNGMSSCMTPLTCYAPSEASIEWSVVTASAADYSGFPDYKGVNGKANNLDRMVRVAKIGRQKRHHQGTLSDRRNIKAVEIVGNEYGATGEMIGGGGGGRGRNEVALVTKFRPESKITGTGSGRGHWGFSNCSIPQSHSQRLLYTR